MIWGGVSNVGEGERSRPEPQRFGRFLGSPARLETLGKVGVSLGHQTGVGSRVTPLGSH